MRRGTPPPPPPPDGHHRRFGSRSGHAVADGLHRNGSSSSDGLSNDKRLQPQPHRQRGRLELGVEVSTDNGTSGRRHSAQPVRPGGRDLPVPATVTDAAGNTSTTATQDGNHRHHRPPAGTLSLTGFTDTGSSSPMACRTTALRSERLRARSGRIGQLRGLDRQGRDMDNDHRQPVRPGGRDLPVRAP